MNIIKDFPAKIALGTTFNIVDIDLTNKDSILNQSIDKDLLELFTYEINTIFDLIEKGELEVVPLPIFKIEDRIIILHSYYIEKHMFTNFLNSIKGKKGYISDLCITCYNFDYGTYARLRVKYCIL